MRNCPGCGSIHCDVFYEVDGVPANSESVLTSKEEAVAVPRGEVALELCTACGLVFNGAFDPNLVDYLTVDGETGVYSPTFRAFQQRLAHRLIERYALHRKDILDIGCGRGEFLALLCELGTNHGIGFDPDYSPDPQVSLGGNEATFRSELFTEDTAVGPTDLICCRMLLQQIADPIHFLGLLRRTLGPRKDGRLFLQVGNVMQTLARHASG
jgi:SAM-dependent methyltransferase